MCKGRDETMKDLSSSKKKLLKSMNESLNRPAEPLHRTVEGLSIRCATLNDLDQLLEWRMEVLHSVFADVADDVDWEALRDANRAYYIHALGSKDDVGCTSGNLAGEGEMRKPRIASVPGHIACFAELDGKAVACGSICLQKELPSPDNPSGRCAYLMNMYTRPAYRGQGIASAVVDWVVHQARCAGAEKIYLETTPVGRAVYERAGFVDMSDMMKLDGPR